MNQQQGSPSTEPVTAKKKSHLRWIIPTTVGVLAFFLGVGAGASGSEPEPAAAEPEVIEKVVEIDPSEEVLAEIGEREAALADLSGELDAREVALDEREASLDQVELEIEAGVIPGPGVYLVGVDIEAGDYRIDGDDCYWARLSGTSGDSDEIITNGFAEGPTVLTINADDHAFENGCGEWRRQ